MLQHKKNVIAVCMYNDALPTCMDYRVETDSTGHIDVYVDAGQLVGTQIIKLAEYFRVSIFPYGDKLRLRLMWELAQ